MAELAKRTKCCFFVYAILSMIGLFIIAALGVAAGVTF